jgi:hypothetical protein
MDNQAPVSFSNWGLAVFAGPANRQKKINLANLAVAALLFW